MYSFEALSSCQNLLSSHDVNRFLNLAEHKRDAILGAIFMQATFPGIAGIYYGDEVGLGGAGDPFNREPFPWHDEESWDANILSYTKELMNLKNSTSILRFGSFELLNVQDDIVCFRRSLENESMLCLVNRDRSTKDIKIPSTAESITIVHGDVEANIDEKNVIISNTSGEIGIIIQEQ